MKKFLLSGFVFLASINIASLSFTLTLHVDQSKPIAYVLGYTFIGCTIISSITLITTFYYWKLIKE